MKFYIHETFKLFSMATVFLAAFLAISNLMAGTTAEQTVSTPPKILLVIPHPDDETMFNMSRFTERGWDVTVVLVTSGENGSVVQSIVKNYNPKKDKDALIEKDPAVGVHAINPADCRVLQEIPTHNQLALERRNEFIKSLSLYRVKTIYFLSSPEEFTFEDNWDNGVKNWNNTLLSKDLKYISNKTHPDIVITLNPDETWGHRQHWGLGKIVQSLWTEGAFDSQGKLRPEFYGIREYGWYKESQIPQNGDESFRRDEFSQVLGMTYADYWTKATSCYITQSSHPIWSSARIKADIVPGYGNLDVIRRLDKVDGRESLTKLFSEFHPDSEKMSELPAEPEIIKLPANSQ